MARRKSMRESFNTRMKILSYMIEEARPVTPKEINDATYIDHYPTVNYHLKCLMREGVVIPLKNPENQYQVQPFMCQREIDLGLKKVVDKAFNETFSEHFVVSEADELTVKIEAFNNAFLYYLKYLLETGKFQK